MTKINYTVMSVNRLNQSSMVSHLGIQITHCSEGNVEATMPVDERTRQPMGFLHGGASLALAETVASIGSLVITDSEEYHVYGVQVSANHINTARTGDVIAKATLINKSRSTHIWNCDVSSSSGKLISTARVTIAIVKKK